MAKEEIFFGINIDTGKAIKDFGTLKKRTKELKKELDGTKVGTKRFEQLRSEITKNQATIRRFNRSLRDTKSLATRVGQGVTTAFKRVGGALAGAFAVGGLIQVLKSGIETIADFEQAIADVGAVSGASAREMGLLEKSARNLGKTSIFTAEEVAGLQLELAKLGFTTSEIISASGGILDLSTAFRIDLSQAAETTASTLRAFGLDADDTTMLTDLMADSFSSTALDITKFQESIKLVAPSARQTGRSVQEVTSLLGLLANNGLSGSIAGTQLNRVFIELNKKGLTLEDAMEKVATSTDKLGTATDLVGDRGAKALAIFSSQSDALKELRDDFSDVAGEAEQLAEKSSDTLTGSFKRLKSAWDELMLSFSNSKGILRDVTDALSGTINLISSVREQETLLDELGFEESFFSSSEERETRTEILVQYLSQIERVNKLVKEGDEQGLEDFIKLNEQLKIVSKEGKNALDTTGEQSIAFVNLYNKVIEQAKLGLQDLSIEQKKVESEAIQTFNILDPTEEDPFANEKVDDARVEIDQDETERFETRMERMNRLVSEQDILTENFIESQEVQRKQMRMTAEYEKEMNNIRLESAASLINSTITFLSRDEKAREKNARLIKAFALAEIAVNTQKALMNVEVNEKSPLFFPNLLTGGLAGLTVGTAQKIAIIAQGLASAATVSSQKFAKGGILNGPSHANGGIKTPFGELEGGEAVINKKSTKKYGGILSAINEAEGGKKFARGGVLGVPNVSNAPSSSNLDVIRAINSINMSPTVSVVEINEAQTRISEIENNSTL